MNAILIVDDREDYLKEFTTIANTKGITNVATARSFEGLKEQMPKLHHKIAVVILDIKCLISENQEIEDEKFLLTALTYLDQHYPNFPRIILTGDEESFSGFQKFNNNEEIFLKGAEDKLFERIQWYCDNSENLKIKRTYPDIFEIFEKGWMDSTQETNLINILKNIDEKNSAQFKGIFVNIRSIQETIYRQIHFKKPAIVPSNKFKSDGMIDFNKLMAHLNGNPDKLNSYVPTTTIYQSNSINHISNGLYRICGEYIHGNISISHYALKSQIYNLLELLIWAKPHLK